MNSNFHETHFYSHSQSIVFPVPVSADNLKIELQNNQTFKTIAPDIILSCLWIDNNLVVTGNKDGSLIFYDSKTGQVVQKYDKVHKSSVCTLALIN